MVLLVGVVDVMVLVLPGVVVGDDPGDCDAAGGAADGEGVRLRVAVPGVAGPWALFSVVLFSTLGWGCCWCRWVVLLEIVCPSRWRLW